MKLGVVFVIAVACKLASCEVYYDQSGYGYGVNPKPSGLPDESSLPSVSIPSKESISSQESKPKAYLVRLKPKDDLESSNPNKKSKFLLLLRLPEDHEETQATSLNSEVQQRDELGYQQSDIPTQDDSFSSSLMQTPYSSFENQKDESGQYQQSELQQYPPPPPPPPQQQQQQDEPVIPQQNDSGYLQPLQTDGYGQAQSNEQAQQKDETYSQQQAQPQLQQAQQQQQQHDVTDDFDQQAKDDSGYQQQSYSQQQDSGYGPVSTAFPSQSQASAFKNGFSPLPNYERPQVQQQMPAVDSVKGLRNNFFRSPVLQETQKTTNSFGSNDFQSRDAESFGGQVEQVKSPAIKSQPAPQPTYGFNSGTKTNSSSTFSEANRDAIKGSFRPLSHPSSDASHKSAPTIHSSYPSLRSPMKSPAQVYAQQQQQYQQHHQPQPQQQENEPARKTVTSPVRDFYGQPAQPESNSYGNQVGFSSEYGSNEESTKSASQAKDSSNYGIKQEGVKTPPKQTYENVQPSPIANDYSNAFNNPQSFSHGPVTSSFAPMFGYGTQQQMQEQPQQQIKQDDYNQGVENSENLQEKDEQSEYSPDQQENEEPEKKMPVMVIPLPPESSPYVQSDNQKKENFDSQQQSYDSSQKSESDYQQSSGSLGNDESNFNAPVKGQAPISNYEQSTQSIQSDSYGQQPSSFPGQKSPSLRFPTKSSTKTQQPVESSSGYSSGVSSSSIKGGRAPQQQSYTNDYSNGFQTAAKDTKSAKPSPNLGNSYSSGTKGGQTNDDGFSNEQKTSVKGSNQPTKASPVQSSYSAALQPPVKAARAFQQSAGYSSEFKAAKGVSESYSKPSQSSVESHFNDYQAAPVLQQSQPEQPQQQKQTQTDLGYNLRAPTKGGRAQPQQSNTDSSYSSNSQSSYNSDYQSSSVKGGAIPQQQNSYSSVFPASPAQQNSGYGSSFYQSSSDGVKGSQNSQIQQQQSDAESLPNQSSQPAFASFSASVKGSTPIVPQPQQNFDDSYSGFQAPIASIPSSAPVQQTQFDRGYSSAPQSSGIKGGQQISNSYEQSPLPNVSGTKSSFNREPKAPLVIPNYRTKSGRSQLSTTKSSKAAPSNQKSPISSYPSYPVSQQTQPEQQQETKGSAKPQPQPQPNTKSALKNPSTSYLPALSPPSATKSSYTAPPQPKSPQQDSSYFSLPVNSQQLQSPKNAPLSRGLPPPPALVARSRPSQSFNFPSSQSPVQPSSESYPSYSASSNTPVFDDEEDSMSITADDMGAYGLRTNSPYDAAAASATSHIRAVEQPQGSGRVVLLLFNKEHTHSQPSRLSLSPDPRGIY